MANFQNSDQITSFLEDTSRDMYMFADEDFDRASQTLRMISKSINDSRDLMTEKVLDALHNVVISGLPQDIGLNSEDTPQQELRVQCLTMLGGSTFKEKNSLGERAIEHLDDIITNGRNYILRQTAAANFCYRMGNNLVATTLLEKHGKENSDVNIRQVCREGLVHIAKNYPTVTERACAALISGMNNDPSPENQERCIALLTNRVRSTSCNIADLPKLKAIFERAAIDHATDNHIVYWAQTGMNEVDERIRTNSPGDYKFP